jgi:hypothetical protein
MPLSNKDLTDIAKEFATAKGEMTDDKAAIPNVQEQVQKKDEQYARMNILYKDAHVERVTPYETEHRWLNGTTYTTITEQQIQDAGARTPSNIFFPPAWAKSNAQLTASGNGNPKTTSPNSESEVLNNAIENGGLISQIGLLRNGQSSSAPSRTLDLAYTPGASTLTFTNTHSFTIGRYLYVSGSGTSALVKITATTSLTVTITEIIPPASTIAIGGTAIESIPGFTNGERQNLTSATFQRILTELTNRIITAAGLYNTALTNQLAQLNINIDAAAQISAAKTSVTNAQTAYSTWNALASTGVSGKWIDTSLDNFATSYNSRNSGISARMSQITTALGSVSQNGNGDYSGTGNYLQRFKCLNFLINSANGPLYQKLALQNAKGNFEQKVANTADKLSTFSNLVRYAGFTKDPTGSTVEVDGASQFAASDPVLLCANDLPSIECTVSSVSGRNIVLSITIPPNYNKAAKGGIIKKV